jgi:hypothetical protein
MLVKLAPRQTLPSQSLCHPYASKHSARSCSIPRATTTHLTDSTRLYDIGDKAGTKGRNQTRTTTVREEIDIGAPSPLRLDTFASLPWAYTDEIDELVAALHRIAVAELHQRARVRRFEEKIACEI